TQNQAADSKNAEAAKYRVQLREAEAERYTLRQQITAMRTAEIERLAGQHIAKPDALWRTGTTIEDLLTEDGTIDAAAVEAAAQTAISDHGLAAAIPAFQTNPGQGQNGGDTKPEPYTWSSALKRRRNPERLAGIRDAGQVPAPYRR